MPRDDRLHDLSPLFDDDEDEIGIGVVHGRRSSSYYRLADPLLRLTVLKLDGSSFDVQVQRTASVRGLKVAVESLFTQPIEDGIEISWSHVWSNFCLNYRGENLIDDGVSLRSLRIKDGDQLHFVKHHLSNYSTIKRLPSNKGILLIKRHRRTMTAPEVLIKFGGNNVNMNCSTIEGNNMNTNCSTSQFEGYADEKGHNYEEDVLVERKEFKLSHFLLRWFSCTGVQRSDRTSSELRTP